MKKHFTKLIIIGMVLSTTVLSISANTRIAYAVCHECGERTMWTVCGNDELQDGYYGTCSNVSGCKVYYYTCSTKEYCKNCGDVSDPFARHDERIEHTKCGASRSLCNY